MNDSISDSTPPSTLDEWTALLCEKEMPIFSNTANTICNSLKDDKKSAMELATVILQDPNLTAQLLKVSNSSYYNPSNQKINTVSRAIVILGEKTIRELTLACAFFESIISTRNKQRASEEIGVAIHAAVQAKQLAIRTNDSNPEEVFIAALLQNIGKIAFWCFGNKQAEQIIELIKHKDLEHDVAEQQVLGFNLQQLSASLAHVWNLGGLTQEAISSSDHKNSRVALVQMGKKLTQAIKQGDDSDMMLSCISELTKMTGDRIEFIKTQIKQNSDIAVKMALKFGANDASRYIKTASQQDVAKDNEEEAVDPQQLQFQILDDISEHISGKIDLNMLFEMVMEGIHRGMKMDRTLFLLVSADKKSLTEKLSLGWGKPENKKIKINVEHPHNLFFESLINKQSIWAHPQHNFSLYTPALRSVIGQEEGFVVPIATENKVIGLVYCDRKFSPSALHKKDYSMVQHFCKQANIGLSLFRTRSL